MASCQSNPISVIIPLSSEKTQNLDKLLASHFAGDLRGFLEYSGTVFENGSEACFDKSSRSIKIKGSDQYVDYVLRVLEYFDTEQIDRLLAELKDKRIDTIERYRSEKNPFE